MKTYNVYNRKWTDSSNVYLAAMDSIKMVMGKRQKLLDAQISKDVNYRGPRSCAEYYGVWSMSGYLGQQKLLILIIHIILHHIVMKMFIFGDTLSNMFRV